MQLKRAAAETAAMLALLLCPLRSRATLDGSNSGSTATARFTGGDFVGPVITPLADQLDVTISNTASETYTPPFGPWLDDFEYKAMILGNGTVGYGSAAGKIETEASATPEFVEPAPGNQNDPTYNQDASTVDATLHLDFQEDGVVSGGAPGAPVTLTVHLLLQATGTMVGGHPSFDRDTIAQFHAVIVDETPGFGSVDRVLYGSGLESVELDTAVGHTLSIEGRLYLFVDGLAGASTGTFGFAPQYIGSIDATIGGLWMDAPEGIAIDAPSGHDYTLPVPEPAAPLLLLAGAAALPATRAFARRRPAS